MIRQPENFDLLEQAQAALSAGDQVAALAAADEAVSISRMADDRPADLAQALRLKALALDGLGRTQESRNAWAEARIFFEGLGDVPALAECDARLNR